MFGCQSFSLASVRGGQCYWFPHPQLLDGGELGNRDGGRVAAGHGPHLDIHVVDCLWFWKSYTVESNMTAQIVTRAVPSRFGIADNVILFCCQVRGEGGLETGGNIYLALQQTNRVGGGRRRQTISLNTQYWSRLHEHIYFAKTPTECLNLHPVGFKTPSVANAPHPPLDPMKYLSFFWISTVFMQNCSRVLP